MRNSLAVSASAQLREEVAAVRPQMLKVDVGAHTSAHSLRTLAGEAIARTYTKTEAAADVLGLNRAHVGRLVDDGDLKLKHLEALGASTLVVLATEILEHYGPLATPAARARQLLRDQRQRLDELEQLIDHLCA